MSSADSLRRWLWRRTEARFPIWTLERQLARFRTLYASEYKEAKKPGNRDKLEALDFEERAYVDSLAELRSKKILRQASRLFVNIQDLLDQDHWDTGPYGNRYLLYPIEYEIRKRVWEARRQNREHWIKIIPPILTAITGVIGAAIGLAAILFRK